jgi:hypothetical protein
MEARILLLFALELGPIPEASHSPAIDVFWADPAMLEQKLPPAGRQAAQDEVAAIYREVGITVTFPESHSDAKSAPTSFHVVLLARSSAGLGLPREALGAILEKDPARNTAFVFLPAVLKSLRHALSEDMKMIHDARKARLFARALGRVVAHEIAHVIDAELPHGPGNDLMSAVLTPRLLQQHRLTFDEATGERLRERVSRLRAD